MKKSRRLKFDVKQVFGGFKHEFFSKFTTIEMQTVAVDNIIKTPELLKPMVIWL